MNGANSQSGFPTYLPDITSYGNTLNHPALFTIELNKFIDVIRLRRSTFRSWGLYGKIRSTDGANRSSVSG